MNHGSIFDHDTLDVPVQLAEVLKVPSIYAQLQLLRCLALRNDQIQFVKY